MATGKVKWFNNAKGYGFIVSDSHDEDLFAHYSSIQMEGYKTLKAGQDVEFDTTPGDKGLHAINIRVPDAPESTNTQTERQAEIV
ncbi:cold shock domain-containing protein CspD [Litoribacillus peritrichatus]|uniref:Cold shock-like protein CspD n=1 Tax=Litoribacillus peritrichatus TaxID=718191 RepID=A0ABP7N199_9GAMM